MHLPERASGKRRETAIAEGKKPLTTRGSWVSAVSFPSGVWS